jgi:hypothetical protein
MKMADEIIQELWNIKDAMADECGCDVKTLVDHLRAKKQGTDTQIVDLRSIDQPPQLRSESDPR